MAAGQDSGRRGTLADLGRSFGGRHKRGMMSSGNFLKNLSPKKALIFQKMLIFLTASSISGGPPPVEPDFMSKIRKRRETSADITVLRKGSGTVTDLKNDISR